jgi:hypothetical protein
VAERSESLKPKKRKKKSLLLLEKKNNTPILLEKNGSKSVKQKVRHQLSRIII